MITKETSKYVHPRIPTIYIKMPDINFDPNFRDSEIETILETLVKKENGDYRDVIPVREFYQKQNVDLLTSYQFLKKIVEYFPDENIQSRQDVIRLIKPETDGFLVYLVFAEKFIPKTVLEVSKNRILEARDELHKIYLESMENPPIPSLFDHSVPMLARTLCQKALNTAVDLQAFMGGNINERKPEKEVYQDLVTSWYQQYRQLLEIKANDFPDRMLESYFSFISRPDVKLEIERRKIKSNLEDCLREVNSWSDLNTTSDSVQYK